MTKLKNAFSLSDSTMNTFKECPRKYWFARFGSWGGWEKNADARTKEIYRLKKLGGLYFWTGNRVHERIKAILQHLVETGEVLPENAQADFLLNQLREDYRVSVKQGQGAPYAKDVLHLLEHDDPSVAGVSDEKIKEVVMRAVQCVRGFYQSHVLQRLLGLTPEARKIALVRKDDKLESLVVNVGGHDVDVFVTLDVLHTHAGLHFITDWKTGKPSDKYADQLGLYAMFIMQKLGAELGKIRVLPVYLAYTPEDDAYMTPTQEHIDQALDRIQSIGGQIVARSSADLETAEEDAFEAAPSRWKCKGCPYRRVCSDSAC